MCEDFDRDDFCDDFFDYNDGFDRYGFCDEDFDRDFFCDDEDHFDFNDGFGSFEQEAECGDIDQSFDVSGGGENSNQSVAIQGVANTGNAQNQIGVFQGPLDNFNGNDFDKNDFCDEFDNFCEDSKTSAMTSIGMASATASSTASMTLSASTAGSIREATSSSKMSAPRSR